MKEPVQFSHHHDGNVSERVHQVNAGNGMALDHPSWMITPKRVGSTNFDGDFLTAESGSLDEESSRAGLATFNVNHD